MKYLVPLALEILQTNILIEGDLYKGDLLSNVLKVDEDYWKVNKKERDYLISIWEKELPNIETCEDISMIKQELFENFEKIKSLE